MNSRILPALAFVIAIAIFFSYTSPTWNGSIAAAKAAIANDKEALDAAHAYVAEQNQLASERDAIDPESLKALATFLPNSVDNVSLTLDLNALAARSGLSISNIDVTGKETEQSATDNGFSIADNDPVGSVTISLSAVGTFGALEKFLYGVEMSARLLDVRDLTIKSSDTGVYDYTMTLRLYWLH